MTMMDRLGIRFEMEMERPIRILTELAIEDFATVLPNGKKILLLGIGKMCLLINQLL